LRSVPDLKLIDYSKSARDLGGSRVTHSGVLTYAHMKDSMIIVLRHPSMCTCIQLPQPNTHEHLHLEPPAHGWNELLYCSMNYFGECVELAILRRPFFPIRQSVHFFDAIRARLLVLRRMSGVQDRRTSA
jgi:hypothetical protein